MKRFSVLLLASVMFFATHSSLWADDFEDGISKTTDDAIGTDDELGKAGKNIKFIIETAKSQAKVAEKNSGKSNSTTGSTTGDNNRNSVVMGAGSNIRGDIYIIDESKK